jgi:hypothetical protein
MTGKAKMRFCNGFQRHASLRIGDYFTRFGRVGQLKPQAQGPKALPLLAAGKGSGFKRRMESTSVQISESDLSGVQGLTPLSSPGVTPG